MNPVGVVASSTTRARSARHRSTASAPLRRAFAPTKRAVAVGQRVERAVEAGEERVHGRISDSADAMPCARRGRAA